MTFPEAPIIGLARVLCVSAALLGPARSDPADFSAARQLLDAAIAARAFPGCAVAAGTSREILWLDGLGSLDYTGGEKATPDTLYDLASLTKVVGTTSVVLALLRDGRIEIDEPVTRRIPEFAGDGRTSDAAWRRAARVEHLLTHSSGLPGWRPIHRTARGYSQVLAAVVAEPLETEPGSRFEYSDLGFILLGEVASRAGGQPLEELERRLVFEPLSLANATRRPRAGDASRIAPTEAWLLGERPPSDGRGGAFVHGIVHDENARAGDGMTGHAGLFASARDVATFAGEVLRGWRGEGRVFPAELLRRFATRHGGVSGSSRALGWDTPSGKSSAGVLFSHRSFGHTGFTGTSLWIDPERDLYILLLTNRVHPTRESLKIAAVRPALADAVARAFDAAGPRRRRI